MEEYQKKLVEELKELKDRKTKLFDALIKKGFREKVGERQYALMQWQYSAMCAYYDALNQRLFDMEIYDISDK